MKTHKIYRVLLAAALFQFIALASSAQISIYASITGQKQGAIKGDVTAKGYENKIEVFGYSDDVISPRDPASGLPTGKRMQKPFMITTHFDSSTPHLLEAMYSNENLPTMELQLYKPNNAGMMTLYVTIKLSNASISEIEQNFDKSATVAADRAANVKIAFTFQKIEFTYTTGGITAMDDWTSTK
ncbi:MAG TPA: type VI secretion system tube protein TssD [Mucilaginibacter sp.]|jgi:type VI secretion system secreted protein Hcp|nr:type VI secretion system tube protein TssD [Mucilaginibacter sp.]